MAKTRRRTSYRKSKRWNPSKRRVRYDSRHNPKRSGSYYRAKKHFRGMSSRRRHAVVSSVLGSMNPRGRKRGGKAFTKHRKGRHWERAVGSSLPHWANPKRGRGRRRNPVMMNPGKVHSAYGQYLFKLGFPANDPIVELGATWASGNEASARLINQAIISAERWRENRDKRIARHASSVVAKLESYRREQERSEGHHQFKHKAGSLVGSFRYANPRRRKSRKGRR